MSGALLYTVVLGILSGIIAAVGGVAGFVSAVVLLAASALLIAIFFWRRSGTFLVAAVFFAAVVIGIVRTEAVLDAAAATALSDYFDEQVEMRGVVASDPELRSIGMRAILSVAEIEGRETAGKVLATVPRGTDIRYGDTVTVRGELRMPEAFVTDAGREFDYPNYLAAQHIVALMPQAEIEVVERAGWSPLGILFTLKHSFKASLERLLPEPHGALMEGLLLGEKSGLPVELETAFIHSSLIHMVVLSGYNIAIVANAVLRTTGAILPHAGALALGGITIVGFALMVGDGEATVRALLMALIAILATYLNRPTAALRSLAVAAAAMALWNPVAAVYSPSLILSVLATFGLITLTPWAERKIVRWKFLDVLPRLKLREIAATTVAVQIFVLPALLYYTGIFSVVALPANLLALPAVPLAMFFGFFAGLAGYLSPILGFTVSIPAYALLQWIIWVAEFSSGLPVASFIVPQFPVWLAIAAYVPLTWFAVVQHWRHTKNERGK